MILGLATVIYRVSDLARAKAWYSTAFEQQPYFDQPFYVGFNIAGYELGLQPGEAGDESGPGGSTAYWRVASVDWAVDHFVKLGATIRTPVQDVGDAIRVATVTDPFSNTIGLIENPHFALPTP